MAEKNRFDWSRVGEGATLGMQLGGISGALGGAALGAYSQAIPGVSDWVESNLHPKTQYMKTMASNMDTDLEHLNSLEAAAEKEAQLQAIQEEMNYINRLASEGKATSTMAAKGVAQIRASKMQSMLAMKTANAQLRYQMQSRKRELESLIPQQKAQEQFANITAIPRAALNLAGEFGPTVASQGVIPPNQSKVGDALIPKAEEIKVEQPTYFGQVQESEYQPPMRNPVQGRMQNSFGTNDSLWEPINTTRPKPKYMGIY
jgi:hypothetical protein